MMYSLTNTQLTELGLADAVNTAADDAQGALYFADFHWNLLGLDMGKNNGPASR
jgi:hypothetical protein